MLLQGKLALVTGGGSGIGEGIAKAFADNGATVIVVDVNEAGAARVALDIGGTYHVLDVSDRTACDALAAKVGPKPRASSDARMARTAARAATVKSGTPALAPNPSARAGGKN